MLLSCLYRYTVLTRLQTFSLTIGGVAQHLISYYKVEDVEQGRLRSPSTLPELASLDISPEYLDKTHFRNPPKVEIGVDGIPRYRGEADDVETSPHVLTSPLAITAGYDEGAAAGKRSKGSGSRYDPYSQPPATGRARKTKKSNSTSRSANAGDTDTEPASPTYPSPVHQPAPAYPETGSLSATTNHYAAPYPYYSAAYPAGYSPASYPAVPVSPVQPPQQSPTPPQHTPATPQQQPLPYPSYGSDSHSQPAQSSVYPYYQSYAGYSAWPQYGYGQVQHGASHASSSASSAQDRAARDAQDDDEGS